MAQLILGPSVGPPLHRPLPLPATRGADTDPRKPPGDFKTLACRLHIRCDRVPLAANNPTFRETSRLCGLGFQPCARGRRLHTLRARHPRTTCRQPTQRHDGQPTSNEKEVSVGRAVGPCSRLPFSLPRRVHRRVTYSLAGLQGYLAEGATRARNRGWSLFSMPCTSTTRPQGRCSWGVQGFRCFVRGLSLHVLLCSERAFRTHESYRPK